MTVSHSYSEAAGEGDVDVGKPKLYAIKKNIGQLSSIVGAACGPRSQV
eukprot:COSAG01_NODE_1524_length_10019_cov_6.258367_5_plen_48_part_00